MSKEYTKLLNSDMTEGVPVRKFRKITILQVLLPQ